MVTRPAHYNTRYKHDLTPRQREVMDLLARGQTNAEIAERLGLTLDGVKWHVREILSKLNLESREQAAAYWRDYNRPLARVSRAMAGVGAPTALKAVLGGGVTLVAVAVASVAVIALRGGGDEPSGTPPAIGDRLEICDLSQVALALGFASASAASDDSVPMGAGATAPEPCRLRADIDVMLVGQDGKPIAVTGNHARVAIDQVITPAPTGVVTGRWDNYCGDASSFSILSISVAGGARTLYVADFPVPRCIDSSRPSVLTVRPAPPSPGATPARSPLVSPDVDARSFAVDIGAHVVAGDLEALLQNLVARTNVCPGPEPPPGLGDPYPLCQGAAPGERREGWPIARHGSDGGTLEARPAFEAAVRRELGAPLALASYGCATTDAICRQVVIAFRRQASPNAVYIIVDRPLQGQTAPKLAAMGLSGDNADTILSGGVTMTDLGETLFTPVK